jgi:hypothetical protein
MADDTTKTLADQKKILESNLKLETDINEQLKIRKQLEEAELKIQEEKLKALEKQIAQGEDYKKNFDEIIKKENEKLQNLVEEKDLSEESNDRLEKRIKLQEQEIEKIEQEYDYYIKNEKSLKEQYKTITETLRVHEAENELASKYALGLKRLGFEQNALKESFLGNIISIGGLGNAFNVLRKEAAATVSVGNLWASLQEEVLISTKALAHEQDAVLGTFNKSTGALKEYNDQILALGHYNYSLGIDTKEIGRAHV